MMTNDEVTCPVCGERLADAALAVCPDCGALLAGMHAEETAHTSLPGSDQQNKLVETADTEEMIRLFRLHYEQHRIELPAAWLDRLQFLAQTAEASRRFATVCFVDLRDYTRLTQRLPESRMTQLMQWFYGVCARRV